MHALMQALDNLNSLQAFSHAMRTAYRGGREELKQRMQGEVELRGLLLAPSLAVSRPLAAPLWASGGPDG